jgi:phosphoglycolate phosphatase
LTDLARTALDWSGIDLVVFDVDGTLYEQRRLRAAMLRRLLVHAVRTRSLATLRILGTYRHVREALGDGAGDDFMLLHYSETARRHGCTPQEVQALVAEWMETAPLVNIAEYRYAGVAELFAALRSAGKRIGVLSDYPAAAKLDAMDLHADFVVCATDPEVACLKPDPRGLLLLLHRAGVRPARALMVGDRFDRDAEVARRAGVRALVRSARRQGDVPTFRRYDDPVFQELLARGPATAAAA